MVYHARCTCHGGPVDSIQSMTRPRPPGPGHSGQEKTFRPREDIPARRRPFGQGDPIRPGRPNSARETQSEAQWSSPRLNGPVRAQWSSAGLNGPVRAQWSSAGLSGPVRAQCSSAGSGGQIEVSDGQIKVSDGQIPDVQISDVQISDSQH